MKKIIMVVLFAVIGLSVSAAQVNWSINADSANKTYSIYAFTMSSADLVAAFASTTESDWSSAIGNAVASGALSNRGAWTSNAEIGDNSSIVFAIVQGDLTDGTSYLISKDMSVAGFTYSGTESSPGNLLVALTDFATSGTFTAALDPDPGPGGSGDVPEPTSGLLLLVGGALLALRRKQK